MAMRLLRRILAALALGAAPASASAGSPCVPEDATCAAPDEATDDPGLLQVTSTSWALQEQGDSGPDVGGKKPLPARKVEGKFVTGPRNSVGCPKGSFPIDLFNCNSAAQELKQESAKWVNKRNAQKGCIKTADGKVQFNYNPNPKPKGHAKPVCKTGTRACPKWEDKAHFDCQLYHGSHWCKPRGHSPSRPDNQNRCGKRPCTGAEGKGWCNYCLSDRRPDAKNFGFAPDNKQQISGPLDAWRNDGLDATGACEVCGADCVQGPSKYKPRPTPENCRDMKAPNGNRWVDTYGYSCDAYKYGKFCVNANQDPKDPDWVPAFPALPGLQAGQWSEYFGNAIEKYSWWAVNKEGKTEQASALDACCVCGGGIRR
mmetsp:Transcript_50152/g.160492  ORF Transcript_50152/g.160492 Transcript_50152/m.160492 type:complete len:372 (-) Transcript_50152:85-1200(-)